MEGRAEFLKKLSGLVALAQGQDNKITADEVKAYFKNIELNEEQMELVFDYLLAQKVVVQGYLKMADEPEQVITYTEEEQAYLDEYLNDLKAFKPESEGEREALFARLIKGDATSKNRLTELYLGEVVEIAKKMYQPGVFLGDLIQEGNMGLIIGLDMLTDAESAHSLLVNQIQQYMQMLLEESTELSNRDKKMIEKVTMLDDAIKELTEELGRKVTIDELALHLGMTEEEIEDILKLLGEESEEEE